MLKQFSEEELFDKPLTKEQLLELAALTDIRDQDIDTSDIPEIKELPPNAARGLRYQGSTVHLNKEMRQYFADLARRKGRPMNDLVNETLAKAIAVAEVTR